MKYKWLNNINSSKLIIFFNGWGMDEEVVSHLKFGEYDVLMFYDYNSLETDFDFSQLYRYTERSLVAWSMGVMTATLFNIDYNKKTAINGTLKPIDNKYGIPVRIYDLTLKGFNPKGCEKFVRNMFDNPANYIRVNRSFEEIKNELYELKNYSANENFKYDKIIISTDDKVIPTKNQTAFWGIEPNINSGHAPFYKFSEWSELI